MDTVQFWMGVVVGFILQCIAMAFFWNFLIEKMKKASIEANVYQQEYKEEHDPANWWKKGKKKDPFGRNNLN